MELLSVLSSSILKVEPFRCLSCGKKYSSARMLNALNGDKLNSLEPQPTTLRYFSCLKLEYINFGSSSTINLLWNLHTIDILSLSYSIGRDFPSEMWEMPQLQTLIAVGFILPDPERSRIGGKRSVSLEQLHTLRIYIPDNYFVQVAARIPNLRKLFLSDTKYKDINRARSLCNLSELSKLQTLELSGVWESIVFPKSLKKLGLYVGGIPWNEMTIIGSLPNLEELTLSEMDEGLEWDPIEGEFLQLKGLCIEETGLVHWRADKEHFPKLEWLRLYGTRSLEAIPLGIGDIPTLHTIRIKCCNYEVERSAKRIWKEQQSVGNDILQIHVTTPYPREKYTLGGNYPKDALHSEDPSPSPSETSTGSDASYDEESDGEEKSADSDEEDEHVKAVDEETTRDDGHAEEYTSPHEKDEHMNIMDDEATRDVGLAEEEPTIDPRSFSRDMSSTNDPVLSVDEHLPHTDAHRLRGNDNVSHVDDFMPSANLVAPADHVSTPQAHGDPPSSSIVGDGTLLPSPVDHALTPHVPVEHPLGPVASSTLCLGAAAPQGGAFTLACDGFNRLFATQPDLLSAEMVADLDRLLSDISVFPTFSEDADFLQFSDLIFDLSLSYPIFSSSADQTARELAALDDLEGRHREIFSQLEAIRAQHEQLYADRGARESRRIHLESTISKAERDIVEAERIISERQHVIQGARDEFASLEPALAEMSTRAFALETDYGRLVKDERDLSTELSRARARRPLISSRAHASATALLRMRDSFSRARDRWTAIRSRMRQ